MAGMGPPPKDPKLRQRRNKVSTSAVLRMPALASTEPAGAPALPVRGSGDVPWHPETVAFWAEVWASPMAAEYIRADVPGLVILAQLVDKFNYGMVALAAEIRLQRQCFGLSPLDRRRLQWEIEKVEAAARRRPAAPESARTGTRDPRRALRGSMRAVK